MSNRKDSRRDKKRMDWLRGWHYLQKDWKQYRIGILLAIAFMLMMRWLFDGVCLSVCFIGLPCPACGLTRAGLYMCTFHFREAWVMNAMIYPIACFVLYFVLCRYMLGKEVKGWRFLLWGLLVGLSLYYIYRMWHYFPQGIEGYDYPVVYKENNLLRWMVQRFLQR